MPHHHQRTDLLRVRDRIITSAIHKGAALFHHVMKGSIRQRSLLPKCAIDDIDEELLSSLHSLIAQMDRGRRRWEPRSYCLRRWMWVLIKLMRSRSLQIHFAGCGRVSIPRRILSYLSAFKAFLRLANRDHLDASPRTCGCPCSGRSPEVG
jgi:hypothetical protein